MRNAFVDADVIVRLLTGDDPVKQSGAAALFEKVEKGDVTLRTPVTTIADVVYVLSSPRLYKVPRVELADMLKFLILLPGFDVGDKAAVLSALDIYAGTPVDFGDALIAAGVLLTEVPTLYSYDRDFDKIDGIKRIEP